MKLTPQQLISDLQKQLLPLYWVSGNEPLLVMEACDAIRHTAAKKGFTHRTCYHLETGFNWNNFIAEANSLSLFSDKSILELRLGSKKLVESGRKALHGYLQSPSRDTIIVIISDKTEAATLKTKWFQKIEAAGAFIQIWPLTVAQLPTWTKQRLQNKGLQLDRAAIQLLVERGEGNLLALVQDIEKLKLLYPEGKISGEQVAAAIGDNARFDVFTLTDAAVSGDGKRVLRILTALKQEGTQAILILWALTREIRMLATVSALIATGVATEQALRGNGVWPRRMPLVKKALQRSSNRYWRSLLQFAAKIDGTIKGAYPGNSWNGLQRLALGLAGVVLFRK